MGKGTAGECEEEMRRQDKYREMIDRETEGHEKRRKQSLTPDAMI